jgi:hypothetical protein
LSVRRRQDQTDAGMRGSVGAFRAREPGAVDDAAARAAEIAAQGRAFWVAPAKKSVAGGGAQ